MYFCNTMSISVELPVFKSFNWQCPLHYSSKPVFYNSFFCFGKQNLKCKWRPYLRVTMSKAKSCPPVECENDSNKFVEVIGIGSRKDSLLELCLESPFDSSSLRFWNIVLNDSANVQLQQRFLGKDLPLRIVEASSFLQTCSKSIILLASAGYGTDHAAAIDILKKTKCVNGFAIAIILKPFSFEGQRRVGEVKDLEAKLQDHINFCIGIDTDRLLEKDLVTLDEALKTANNAVLLAVNAISILLSDMRIKLIDNLHTNVKELKVSEVLNILGSYKEAKIGFGVGSSIKASILQAIYDCPFIGAGVKELNGVVICIIASSNMIDGDDLLSFLHTFRQTTEYTGGIIVSSVDEPNLESNLLVTTVITLDSLQPVSQRTSILSRLAYHFPFFFNLLKRRDQQSNDTQGDYAIENTCLLKVIGPPDPSEMENNIPVEGSVEEVYNYSGEARTVSSNYNNIYASSQSGQSEAELSEATIEPSNFYDQISGGTHCFQREPLNNWNLGPGYQIAQQWAKERAAASQASTTIDNLSIFCLPVGVRASEELKDGISNLNSLQQDSKNEDDAKALPSSISSLGALAGASFEVVRDFYSSTSTLLKGKTADVRKKQGLLSTRAASMLENRPYIILFEAGILVHYKETRLLAKFRTVDDGHRTFIEAERDSQKKWTPLVEMLYRGGVYNGRCQGGLPEGKGSLILGDGSVYDGMWRYGKRSGLGIFYFSNGDVFQGSWRDDVMHGKGWFYFHTGDRWFANFWKGKANGEGRFYSKSGDIFFGHFRDGWRHGQFICINVHGERCTEFWDEGVLVSRKQLDSDSASE